MTSPTPRDWEELKKLAEAATPGPWDHETKKYSEAIYTPHRFGPSISISWGAGSRNSPIWGTPERAKADAAFIAAFNPATVLELIAEVERLEGEKEALDGAVTALLHDDTETEALRAELSQLKAERDRMAEALGPFADIKIINVTLDDGWTRNVVEAVRRARSALNTGETDG